jgi:hypothetical protein
MQAHYEARHFTSCDSLWAAASYVAKEYGDHGYRIGLADTILGRVSVFEVAHSDGSRFNIAADRWGNVRTLSDDLDAATAELTEMAKQASMV